MNTSRFNLALRSAIVCLLLTLLAVPPVLRAASYATGLTNTGTSISFRLSSSADNVRVIYNGGATTNNLGARPAGVVTTNLVIAGPFSVQVTKISGAGYLDGNALLISSDAANETKFFSPRGVAVNNDPASPYFGRVYVGNALAGTASSRLTGDGIYVLNSDLTDAVGQGNTALDGGLNFLDTFENTSKPWRLEVGQDGNLYIADWTTNTGGIYITDPNVSAGSGTNLLAGFGSPGTPNASTNHGQIGSSVIAFGSLGGGDLKVYALEGDIDPVNRVRCWNIGSGPIPSDAVPTNVTEEALLNIAGVTVDFDIGPDGKYYLLQNRSDGGEAGIIVLDPLVDAEMNGWADVVYNSLEESLLISGTFDTNDFLFQSRAVAISPNGKLMAVVRSDGDTWIVPLTNGIPMLAGRKLIDTSTLATGRDIAFDAAGNLYVVNNGNERLRVFAPGLKSVAVTSSSGTFTVTNTIADTTTVNLSGTDTNSYERISADTAGIIVTRVGDLTGSLTVNFTYSGSAVRGVDYNAPLSIVIPPVAGAFTNLLVPIDDAVLSSNVTAIVSLAPGSYEAGTVTNIAVLFTDDEQVPGSVIFTDNFDTDTSANWAVVFGAVSGPVDYSAQFSYDYGLEGIPPAPNSSGTTRGLKVRVNKDGTAAITVANVYAIGQSFSGDYALRFDLYISVGSDVGASTEHTLAGINHSGTRTNRHGVAGTDGVWFAIDGDASNNRGFGSYLTPNPAVAPTPLVKNNTEFVSVFSSPPYGFAGSPNNLTNSVSQTGSGRYWADAEISQVGDVVRFKLNNTLIFERTNTTAFTSGTIMVGHNDQFASIGSTNNYSLFDNIRIVSLAAPRVDIDEIRVVGGTVEIDFTAVPAGTVGDFDVYSSANVAGPYVLDNTAIVTSLGGNRYRATTAQNGAIRFYRIAR